MKQTRSNSKEVSSSLYIDFREARPIFNVDKPTEEFKNVCQPCRNHAAENDEKLSDVVGRNHVRQR